MMNPLNKAGLSWETAQSRELTARALQGTGSKDMAKLKEACEDFEQIFVKLMLDSMRNTLDGDSLIPQNAGEKLFEDKLYDEYAAKISKTANLGIASLMYSQLSSILPGETWDQKL